MISLKKFFSRETCSLSVDEAMKILGESNVFARKDCIKHFGLNGGPFVEPRIPFTSFQLRRVNEVTGGKTRLFVRYAKLDQVVQNRPGEVKMPSFLYKEEIECATGHAPRYCLVAFDFEVAAKYLKEQVKAWGLQAKTASLTTGVSAALLSLQCGAAPQREVRLTTKHGGAAAMWYEDKRLVTRGVERHHSAAPMIEFRPTTQRR